MEFTLESQNGKEGLIYRDGKLLLDVPEELKTIKMAIRVYLIL